MCCGLLPSRHSTLTDLVLFLNGIEVSVLIMLFARIFWPWQICV